MASVAVDSSHVICILNIEPDGGNFAVVLLKSPTIIGAPTLLEVRIWCLRHLGRATDPWLDEWLANPANRIVAFDADHERLASLAYDRFGKGRHPAALNFGDAMTYAVAKYYHAPLLFKGSDFGKTDLLTHESSVL